MIAEVKSTPDFRKKENRRKPEITFSFNPVQKLKKISTRGLTVLIICVILQLEQRKRDKKESFRSLENYTEVFQSADIYFICLLKGDMTYVNA